MSFEHGDELAQRIFSPNPFEYGDELAKRIFRPNPTDKREAQTWLAENLQAALAAGPSDKLRYSQLFDSLNSFDRDTAQNMCKEILGMRYYMHVGTISKLLNTTAGDLFPEIMPQEISMRRRRNPFRYNPAGVGNCPHCNAGLRQKHYNQNQCWRCKAQLSAGRSASIFGRAPGAALGIAARRRRLLRRRNPTETSFFEHDAGVFGGPTWGRRRLRRYNPFWDWEQVKETGKRTAGRAAMAAGRELQDVGQQLSAPNRLRRRLRRYRYNPGCADCGCKVCTCGISNYRYNPGCPDCGCDMCTCNTSQRYRYNPCDDCNSDPCTCGSHSAYFPNPITRHWDPLDAPTARWEPNQAWNEAEPVEDQIEDRFRRYRRN